MKKVKETGLGCLGVREISSDHEQFPKTCYSFHSWPLYILQNKSHSSRTSSESFSVADQALSPQGINIKQISFAL